MPKSENKRIIFVIVEGPSDEAALGLALEKVFMNEKVVVQVTYGDITTRKGVTPDNIIKEVDKFVKQYQKNYHFKKSDFLGIIHIADTDGAFINNDFVIEDSSLAGTVYSLDEIRTFNKVSIEKRNGQKRNNLGRLSVTKQIASIPYRVFYMSSNLDHVLYDKQISTDSEKEFDAHLFAKRYKDDIKGFLKFICESSFSVPGNYKETWDFIKQGKNSLHRHTNLGICLKNKGVKVL
jgi:hypothetical protein